jgi:hypothetical protein
MISFSSRRLRQQLLQEAEQEVDVQAAFVRLVDDQRVVLLEPGVALRLGEQDAVGHQLDEGIGRTAVAETDLVADEAAGLALQLLGDARRRGAGGDPPRLRMADQAARAATELEADLRDLRRLAGAGLAADDDHLVLRDQRRDLVAAGVDRQVVGKLRLRQARAACGDRRPRALEQALALGLQGVAPGAEDVPQVARQRAQTALVGRQAVGEGAGGWGWPAGGGGNGLRAHRGTGNRRACSRCRAAPARRVRDDSKADDIRPTRLQRSASSGLRTARPPRLRTCV